jgi:hypothetical protein
MKLKIFLTLTLLSQLSITNASQIPLPKPVRPIIGVMNSSRASENYLQKNEPTPSPTFPKIAKT